MRALLAVCLVVAASACHAKPANDAPAQNRAERTVIAGKPVTLTAADGVKVFGTFVRANHPKALILLFHQAGSSRDEYATLAPWLAQNGYSSLAIDQRAGGGLYGVNQTAKAFGREVRYREARPDMQAALGWAQQQKLPIILWGSSYSSSLIFPLAADDPQGIVALLAFSPGEYFDGDPPNAALAAKMRVPVFIASTKEETSDADPIMAALPKNPANVRFVPEHGVHGSSTLIEQKNPAGAEAGLQAVMSFLNAVVPAK